MSSSEFLTNEQKKILCGKKIVHHFHFFLFFHFILKWKKWIDSKEYIWFFSSVDIKLQIIREFTGDLLDILFQLWFYFVFEVMRIRFSVKFKVVFYALKIYFGCRYKQKRKKIILVVQACDQFDQETWKAIEEFQL